MTNSRFFQDLKIPIDESLEEVVHRLVPGHGGFRVLKKSLDARRRHQPTFVYSIEVAEPGQRLAPMQFHLNALKASTIPPLIVGSGPAGLFAALRLVQRGIKPIIFERGSRAEERIKGINRFWRYGALDLRNNVCFGEGGAGLYSDGKLITRINSELIPWVMNQLVQFGAPEEIQWLANPHVGSDRLRRVIPYMRQFLMNKGCQFYFDTQITELIYSAHQVVGVRTEYGQEFKSPAVILATGHSATDMLMHLHQAGVHLDGKSFAIGLRIEHPQSVINHIQYREFANHPKLGAANYKLTHHQHSDQSGVYSFCMCPGGYVLSSGTESDGIVCNGMSNYSRSSKWANSAIVVSIDHQKLFGSDQMGGLQFRQKLEVQAKSQVLAAGGTKQLPAQKITDFLSKKLGSIIENSCPSGAVPTRLDELLPAHMRERLIEGLTAFEKKMPGFVSEQALLFGIESRTSCPVRITRDPNTLQSISHSGLYPAGEGAGYSGGITSSACDGARIADQIFTELGGKL